MNAMNRYNEKINDFLIIMDKECVYCFGRLKCEEVSPDHCGSGSRVVH